MTALEKSRERLSYIGLWPSPEPMVRQPGSPLLAGFEAEVILVFASNTEVLNVEDFLEEKELDFELVPVPKEVNPNCGLAISFPTRVETEVRAALAEAGFRPRAVYLRRGDEFREQEGVVSRS